LLSFYSLGNFVFEYDDVYLVFIGFSNRGSIITDDIMVREMAQKSKDPQYLPNIFMFEKTQLDREL